MPFTRKQHSKHHSFKLAGGARVFSAEKVCSALQLSGLIELKQSDWELLPAPLLPFWHFYRGRTQHFIGGHFGIARELRTANRDGPLEVLPLLSADVLLKARVLRCAPGKSVPRMQPLAAPEALAQQITPGNFLAEMAQTYALPEAAMLEALAEAGVSSTLLVIENVLTPYSQLLKI